MAPEEPWQPDLQAIGAEIAAGATRPPEVPECFVEWLRDFWNDTSEDEAAELWRRRSRDAPWVCAQYLRCVDAVLRDPPPDVVELMQEHGWVNLFHRDETPWRPYDRDEYLAWLAGVRERFTAILAETSP